MYLDGSFFYKILCAVITPLAIDLGKCLLLLVGCQACYLVMRTDFKAGITKVKHAVVGFVFLKCLSVLITIIDVVTNQIQHSIKY